MDREPEEHSEMFKKAAATQLAKMQQSQLTITFHLLVMQRFSERRRFGYTDLGSEDVRRASQVIFAALSDLAQRDAVDALLFAELTGDKDIKARAAEVLWSWMMSDNAGVMQFLEPNGLSPSRYYTEVSARLHAEIRNQLKQHLPEAAPYPDDVNVLQGTVSLLERELSAARTELYEAREELRRIKTNTAEV
jgi:hypothetical protein